MKPRIGELLVKNGIITEAQLKKALVLQKEQEKRLGEILIELGHLSSKDLVWILSEQADIPFVEIRPEMLDKKLINAFPENILYDNSILPLYETEDRIYIALGDPTETIVTQEVKRFTTKEVVTSGADPHKIEQLLNKFFLSQQMEESLQQKKVDDTAVKIVTENATIEFTDKQGKVTTRNAPIEIVMTIRKEKGDKG
jgi:type IV pilus assembly protein PilB